MDHNVAGKWLPLYEMLGMTPEDAERISSAFGVLIGESTSPGDLCSRVVDKYGVDAVCASICLYIALEKLDTEHSELKLREMMQCPCQN